MAAVLPKEAVKDAILDATDRLLARYGYKKMTVEDISVEVGIGKGAAITKRHSHEVDPEQRVVRPGEVANPNLHLSHRSEGGEFELTEQELRANPYEARMQVDVQPVAGVDDRGNGDGFRDRLYGLAATWSDGPWYLAAKYERTETDNPNAFYGDDQQAFNLLGAYTEAWLLWYGLLFMAVVLFKPEGLAGMFSHKRKAHVRRTAPA